MTGTPHRKIWCPRAGDDSSSVLGRPSRDAPPPLPALNQAGHLKHGQRTEHAGGRQTGGHRDLIRRPGRAGRKRLIDKPLDLGQLIEQRGRPGKLVSEFP